MNSELATFQASAISRLNTTIEAYYNYIQDNSAPGRVNVALLRLKSEIQRILRQLHTEAAILAHGSNLNAEDRSLLASRIADDQSYMDGFIADIPTLSVEQAKQRAALYVSTILDTYNKFTVIGLPELPIMPKSTKLECSREFPACKCTLDILMIDANSWDVRWVLNADESCDDCIRLSQSWNPLKIRDGVIQNPTNISSKEVKRIKSLLAIAAYSIADGEL